MVTEHDKGIVALIMAAIQVANSFGLHVGLDESTVTGIVAFLTPIVVWLVPNKSA